MSIYPVCFVLTFVLQLAFVPLFLKYSWPEKCWKSFRLKMVCASLFLLAAVFAMKLSGNYGEFAKTMLLGLIFGWFGDLFLHVITKNVIYFAIGLVSFLVGHVFYVLAFIKVQAHFMPDAPAISVAEIICVILMFAGYAAYAIVTKMKFGIALVPVILYAFTIAFMLFKGLTLCTRLALLGNEMTSWAIATIGIGAILFVLSDTTLALLLFGGKAKDRTMKIFNIGTYFAGQMLLASSILLFNI